MGIATRLATISQEIYNIENEKRELELSMAAIWDPLFLSFLDPSVLIQNLVQDLQNRIRILEMRKRALLQEQQSLIVVAAHRRNSN